MFCALKFFSSNKYEPEDELMKRISMNTVIKKTSGLHECGENVNPLDFYPRCVIPERSHHAYDTHPRIKRCSCRCVFWCIVLVLLIFSSVSFLMKNCRIIIIESEGDITLNEVRKQVFAIRQMTEKKIEEVEERLNELMIILKDKNITDSEGNIACQNQLLERQINQVLLSYDADKIGMFDYAAHYAGGSVVGIPDTTPYPLNQELGIFGMFKVNIWSKADTVLQPNSFPGECFAFYGREGKILIKLGSPVAVTAVSLEHISPLLIEDQSSAPKDFLVKGMNDQDEEGEVLGKFTYSINRNRIQTFKTVESDKPLRFVLVHILNNHGKDEFTCIYRFRVHSTKS